MRAVWPVALVLAVRVWGPPARTFAAHHYCPSCSSTGVLRSDLLPHSLPQQIVLIFFRVVVIDFIGGRTRIRTLDPLIKNHLPPNRSVAE